MKEIETGKRWKWALIYLRTTADIIYRTMMLVKAHGQPRGLQIATYVIDLKKVRHRSSLFYYCTIFPNFCQVGVDGGQGRSNLLRHAY
jgi:hypothetical protein